MTTFRFGVFAVEQGWRVADGRRTTLFKSRSDALAEALRCVRVALWRGGKVQLLFQERPGEELAEIDLTSVDSGGISELRRRA